MDVKVLVADDHHMIRQGFVQLIDKQEGLQVVGQAKDGIEALNLIKTKKPDVVVLDISMPKMSGLEVVREIRKENIKIACVLLTMYFEEEYLEDALEQGVLGYILKENTAEDLFTGY